VKWDGSRKVEGSIQSPAAQEVLSDGSQRSGNYKKWIATCMELVQDPLSCLGTAL